jgi:hypothetical protein
MLARIIRLLPGTALIALPLLGAELPPAPETLAPPKPPPSDTDEANKLFNDLYGADLARVKATLDGEDDARLAGQFLEAARAPATQRAVAILLCSKAVELASRHPKGLQTAEQAMAWLEAQAPESAESARGHLAPLYRNEYRIARETAVKVAAGGALVDTLLRAADAKAKAGDVDAAQAMLGEAAAVAGAIRSDDRAAAIKDAQKRLSAKKQAASKLARLKSQLQGDPANAAARKALVETLVVDFDNPAEAARHAEGLEDAALKRCVAAAALGVEATPEPQCLEPADWYRSLAEAAPKEAKAALYARAQDYYARFLQLHAAADLERTRAGLTIKKIEAELDKLRAADDASAPPVKVTFHWSCADDADVYVNGKPLRDYTPDFHTRGDEAPKTFSKDGALRPGDVITVGARRGGSCGVLLVAVDARGKVVWKTDARTWRVYYPPEGTSDKWYEPAVARRSRGAPAQKAPGWPPQREINARHGGVAESIWDTPEHKTCHLYSIVR